MGAYAVKQLIIIRKDLQMNKGKLAAQASHASLGSVLRMAHKDGGNYLLDCEHNPVLDAWLNGSFAKVALAVHSEEELEKYHQIAQEHGFPCAYIVDNGTTVFNGVKTPTCLGVGPVESEKLDALFNELKLY